MTQPLSPFAAPKRCERCFTTKDPSEYTRDGKSPDLLSRVCRACQREYRVNLARRKANREARRIQAKAATAAAIAAPSDPTAPHAWASVWPRGTMTKCDICGVRLQDHPASVEVPEDQYDPEEAYEVMIEDAPAPEPEPEPEPAAPPVLTTAATDFVPSPELVGTWAAVGLIQRRGGHAPNLLFTGPSGSGKTEAARYLARVSGLPFVKIDATSMTDPESWFGTREVVVEDGAPKTVFVESDFAKHLRIPCVMLIDEVNRVADHVRQIFIPVLDDSRAVINPLTGEEIVRHAECYIVMTANVGLLFTGTYAMDPALIKRVLTTPFDYLAPEAETALLVSREGCSVDTARLLVRFAKESRNRAKSNEDFPPISTREALLAASLAAVGLDISTAVRQAIINGASAEGGAESVRAQLEMIWTGIRKPA